MVNQTTRRRQTSFKIGRRSGALRSHFRVATLIAALCMISVNVVAGPVSATTPGKPGLIAYKGFLDADQSTGAIFTIRPDGTGVRQVTFPEAGTVDDQPDWSPDGSLLAFRRCAPDTVCALYTVRPDGSRLHRLSQPCTAQPPDLETKCADESEVAFLPDGRHVVFTRSTGTVREFPGVDDFIEHSDVVIRSLSGRGEHVILRSRPFAGDNGQLVSSPDGRRIAFVRHNSPLAEPAGGEAVFVMSSNGHQLRRITPWSLHAGDHPDWSPDGRWLLFSSPHTSDFLKSQLYVVHPDGRALRQITHVGADTMLLSGSFSPDGRRVVYARTGFDGKPDVVTERLNGAHEHQVTRTPLWESAPDWGPRPELRTAP